MTRTEIISHRLYDTFIKILWHPFGCDGCTWYTYISLALIIGTLGFVCLHANVTFWRAVHSTNNNSSFEAPGGLLAEYKDISWVGVELEPRSADLPEMVAR